MTNALNSYIILFSRFRIKRSKLILISKNLLRIACLMHFFTKKKQNKTKQKQNKRKTKKKTHKQINKQTNKNIFFKTQISKRSIPTDLHHPDLHIAQFFNLESQKISSAYAKTSLWLKMGKFYWTTKKYTSISWYLSCLFSFRHSVRRSFKMIVSLH